jgi:predicted kinase
MSSSTLQAASITRLALHTGLSSHTIIFMNGPSLTGKTTIAARIGRYIGIPVLATHEHGSVLMNGVLDPRKRLDRYQPVFARAHPVLAAGGSVILDASFLDYTRRSPLYALARRFGVRLIAIRTSCDDLELIRAREQQRVTDPRGRDRDVGMDAYLLTRGEVLANPLEQDAEFWELGVEVVEFRTGKAPSISCATGAHADARLIASILEERRLLASSRARVPRVSGRRAGATT